MKKQSLVDNWSSSWYADMGCCSNYIFYPIWTPITNNLLLNLMVLVVYMHIRKQQRLSWLWAKALLFQIICCMHIQITTLVRHTGINLGVWYAGWLRILSDESMKIYTRSHKMSFIHVHLLQRPKAIHVNGYKSVEEPVKAKKMHNFFHILAVCKHKKDFN